MDRSVSQIDEALISEAHDLAEAGNHTKAIAIYSELIDRHRASVLFHQRGLSYSALGEFIDAVEDFTAAIDLDHSDPDSYFNRGNVYLKLNSYESAINDYNIAIDLAPDSPKILNSRGFALAKSGQLKKGLSDLKSAIALDESYVSPHHNLGILYFEAGDLAAAEAHLEAAARMSPDDDAISDFLNEARNVSDRST